MKPANLQRWLLVSVVANIFLVGGIAGGAWRWWTAERLAAQAPAPAAVPARGLRYAADTLPEAQRLAYRVRLREAHSELDAAIQASRTSRRDVMRELAAPVFDRAAATAALAHAREADMAQRARYEEVVIDFAATLSPAERQAFAAGLNQKSNLALRRPPQEPR